MNTRKLEELGDADEIYANPNGLRQTVDCRYPEGDLRKGLKPEMERYRFIRWMNPTVKNPTVINIV